MISFIIPTLREASVIEKTLLWLSGYKWEKEIIISDGGSTDATIEIAKKYTDKIIIYTGEKRQTIGMGRNLWASIASGEYLVFLDADVTIFDPDTFFAEALRILETTPNLVALTAPMRVLPEMETYADRIIFGALGYLFMFFNNVLHIGWASGEFQMVRHDAFKKVGGFDEELIGWEDKNHFEKLAKIGRTLSARTLTIYHTGRRAHKIGWPRLLMTWSLTLLPIKMQKILWKEWKVVR